MTFDEILHNGQIRTYIAKADAAMEAIGYTEHSFPHVTKVANEAAALLTALGYGPREAELAKIAGYMHDIGNVVNRVAHAQSSAIMAFRLLDRLGADAEDIADVVSAIGNHDEGTAFPVNPVAAALILADKTDVRRSRVRNQDPASFDIHDRVNYAVQEAKTSVSPERDTFTLDITLDTEISSVMDYFEIFLDRMLLCRKACERLDLRFSLVVNGQTVL